LWGSYIVDMFNLSKESPSIASRQECERDILIKMVGAHHNAPPEGFDLEQQGFKVADGPGIMSSWREQKDIAQKWCAALMKPGAWSKPLAKIPFDSILIAHFEQAMKIVYAMLVSYDTSRKGDANKFRNWVQTYRGQNRNSWVAKLLEAKSRYKSGTENSKKMIRSYMERAKKCSARWNPEDNEVRLTMANFVKHYEKYTRPEFYTKQRDSDDPNPLWQAFLSPGGLFEAVMADAAYIANAIYMEHVDSNEPYQMLGDVLAKWRFGSQKASCIYQTYDNPTLFLPTWAHAASRSKLKQFIFPNQKNYDWAGGNLTQFRTQFVKHYDKDMGAIAMLMGYNRQSRALQQALAYGKQMYDIEKTSAFDDVEPFPKRGEGPFITGKLTSSNFNWLKHRMEVLDSLKQKEIEEERGRSRSSSRGRSQSPGPRERSRSRSRSRSPPKRQPIKKETGSNVGVFLVGGAAILIIILMN